MSAQSHQPDRRGFLRSAAAGLVAAPAAPAAATIVAMEPVVGPDFDSTCLACRWSRSRGQPDCHARHLLWEQARDSEANHAVSRLLSLLEEASDLITEFTDRHGEGCPCVFCTHNDWSLNCCSNELFGLQWALDMGRGMVDNLAITIPDREAGDDADAPHVATVGGRS